MALSGAAIGSVLGLGVQVWWLWEGQNARAVAPLLAEDCMPPGPPHLACGASAGEVCSGAK